ncbi:MAG: twin-arginine translocase TatA/TatE family subunit [Deltaproteobacteria bacterium]|nr:twin-arginine translocase TatA/TatE family subunit [Deltaproteobacteria bacterium]
MFGIGLTEIILILVVALLVVGPRKLPELARTLGRGMAEFRRATDDLKQSIYRDEDEVSPEDRRRAEERQSVSRIEYPEACPAPAEDGAEKTESTPSAAEVTDKRA